MKIFHTADWHLGKIVHGVSMLSEQRYILQQFIEKIKEKKPHVVIIAGDLYDRAIPPSEAVDLLNEFLDEVVLSLNIPVIAIAGNHDSPSRLEFGSRLMQEKGFYITGQLDKKFQPIILEDEFGPVHFYPVPYFDLGTVRHLYDDEAIETFDDAFKLIAGDISASMDKNVRNVFIGHAFVTPHGEKRKNTSDSERILSIGGIEYVNAAHFKMFDYVALGHLHQAHFVKEEKIRYAGSPLKYSISEEHHQKGYFEVDLLKDGSCTIEKQTLVPRRDMRTVEGTIEEILNMEPSDDFVFVRLLNRSPVLSPMEKVRSVFPNALHLERPFDDMARTEETFARKKQEKQSDFELFTAFYEEVKGFPPDERTLTLFREIVEELIIYEKETKND
ncbi:MAG: exonuclease SbcCD subunit D [Bacilli bacterium]|nr:exonuclease SbcCD subunit D [Bacilli bacterium]